MPETNEPTPVRLVWADPGTLPVLTADEFSIMFGREGEFILTIGQVSPPILLGSAEEQQTQLREIGAVTIRPLARYGITKARLEAFVAALESNLSRHDAFFEKKEK